MAPSPASHIEKPKAFAEVILTVSNFVRSILSFIDLPFGLETFNTGLTLLSCGTAIRELHLKFFSGGVLKGPAAKPDFTQVATQSVTSFPYSMDDGQFPTSREGNNLVCRRAIN